jgi:predicted transcriptional regulator
MSSQAYVGASKRTFQQALIHELETNYGFLNSKRMLTFLAEDIQVLVDQFYPPREHLGKGWLVFTGTKATGPKAFPGQDASDQITVTIAWPLLLPEDLTWMATQPDTREKRSELCQRRIVRLIEYGWQHPQGPVLLTQADLSLMLGLTIGEVSALLMAARQATGKPLLTKGYFFDQGLRPTHKAEIIALYERGIDEADIARTTNHSPTSVGRYLRDYERVKELIKRNLPLAQIARLLGLQASVVRAYCELLQHHRPDLLVNFDSTQLGT